MIDYQHGFKTLNNYLAKINSVALAELNTLEARFFEIDRNQRTFGRSENTRSKRSQIIYALNALALEHCEVAFNDLCKGVEITKPLPPIPASPTPETKHPTDVFSQTEMPPQLQEAIDRGTLTLFIGSDLPTPVTGLPSRADLGRRLAQRYGLDESLSLAEVAQRVGNRHEFTDFIRTGLDVAGKSPRLFHRKIAELVKTYQIQTIITTTYDTLLDKAFEDATIAFNHVVRSSEVTFINPNRPTLIKLYGDAQQLDSLIVTEQDHSALLRDREKEDLVDEVRRVLRQTTVLFLGYNLTDPDFRFIFDQIGENKFTRTAYAVWPGLPTIDVQMWRDREMVILSEPPFDLPLNMITLPTSTSTNNEDTPPDTRRGNPMTRTHPAPPTEIHNRYALLIGVRDYKGAYRPLLHTINDVTELAARLTEAGYTVKLLHDDLPDDQPNYWRIWNELGNLAEQTGPGDLLLVYFGGHGFVDKQNNAYLIPRGLSSKSDLALQKVGINLSEFKAALADSPAQATILLLDACQSGMGRSVEGMDPAFEQAVFKEATGNATLAACRQGEVAYDYETDHGAFTYFVLQALNGAFEASRQRGFVTFTDLNHYVTSEVKNWAISKSLQQRPNAQTNLEGDPPLLYLPTAQPSYPATDQLPNPFTATGTIYQTEAFIGRAAELRRLQVILQSGSVSIIGDPKIGKSSLLQAVKRAWPGDVLGPIDCQSLEDAEDFFQALAKTLKLDGHSWRGHLRPALREANAILILDELDYAADLGLTPVHLGRLRAIRNANPRLKLLTASRRPLKEIVPDPKPGSEWYNTILPFTLGPLIESEATELLQHPWLPGNPQFDPNTTTELLELTGCHPFKLQRAAYHCFEALTDTAYNWKSGYQLDMEHLL